MTAANRRGASRRGIWRAGALGVLLLCVLPVSAAYADTSTATGQAASVTLSDGSVVTSGQAAADNDGSQSGADQGGSSGLSVLAPQTLITSGVLVQHAQAASDGSSAACAGIVGSGGSVTIAADHSCTITPGTSGGVVIALTPLVKIKADAIVASCTASSNGATAARTQLVNAAVYTTTGLTTTNVALASNPGIGISVSVPAVASLMLNAQGVSAGAGSISATALSVSLLTGTVGAHIAAVACGPNAVVLPTPALPVHGLPIAAAGILLAAAGWFRRYRRDAVQSVWDEL